MGQASADRADSATYHELLLVAGAVALSVIVHGFFVVRGFGEPDVARLAVTAGEWHATGKTLYQSYVYRTSPLYIHALKKLLDLGLPLAALPAFLNLTAVILGSLTLVPLYLLWRKLANRLTAAIACLLFSFTPAFWLANVYGMAHLPSFSLFVTALLVFTRSLDKEGRSFVAHMVGATVLAVGAVCLKADMILSCGAFLGVCVYRRALRVQTVVWAIAIPVLAVVEVAMYTRWLAPSLGGMGDFAAAWSGRFPFTMDAVRDPYNRGILAQSMGRILFALSVSAVAYCVLRRYTRELLLVALWALPTIVFWGLKMGNSARHMMAAVCVLVFLAALVVLRRIRTPWLLGSVTACVLTLNYVLGPSKGNSISPTTQLHVLKDVVQKYVGNLHEGGRSFALLPMPAKMFVGGPGAPYAVFEVMTRANKLVSYEGDPEAEETTGELVERWPRYVATFPDNKSYVIGIKQVPSPYHMPPMDDWFAFSNEGAISTTNDMRIWQPYLTEAVRENPERAFEWATTVSLRVVTGISLAEAGHLEEALAMFQEALYVVPNDADALWNAAMLLAELDRIPECRERLTQFLRYHPKHEFAPVAREKLAETESPKP